MSEKSNHDCSDQKDQASLDQEGRRQIVNKITKHPKPQDKEGVHTFKTTIIELSREQQSLSNFHLKSNLTTIGRSANNNIILENDETISRLHAQINYTEQEYLLVDLMSAWGTFLNGTRIQASQPQVLSPGDIIRIGTYELTFVQQEHIPQQESSSYLADQTHIARGDFNQKDLKTLSQTTVSKTLDLTKRDQYTIGRDDLNDLVISHPSISRFHSQIKRQHNSFYIFDLNSTNGTFVNGERVPDQHLLQAGDTIRIGPCHIVVNSNETLSHSDERGKLGIDAINLNKFVDKDLNLLQDISLSIQSREFVVIAGVSGGGKSTLLDALSGFRPANGFVGINGTNLYQNFDAYRTSIGYVPQRDIVHMELSVEEALDYAAQLRMPADTTKTERHRRVNEVIGELGLTHRRKVPIKLLSGGQLKRVSIGVELIVKPSLFFLDEATSGLDPGIEAEIMQLLRKLADQGCTVILITHATENVRICDQVVFLARGGYLAYFGPPTQAPAYFGVEKFNQIYQVVEHDYSPEHWRQEYLQTELYQKYIVNRQHANTRDKTHPNSAKHSPPKPGIEDKKISTWTQFLILSRRNLSILLRDPASLVLMLAIAPVLGLLDLVAWDKNLFDPTLGDAGMTISMLFVTSLIAVMVGSLTSMREIVKERDIYRRERIIGLKIAPYILSKLWIGILLALYQSAVFLGFKIIAVDIPTTPSILIGIYITLVLTTISGMVMGLLGSSLAPNQNVAPLIAIIFLVPQIIFGGGILPTDTLSGFSRILNQASLTKWSFESLMTITEVGKSPALDPCWAKVEKERNQLSDTEKEACACMGNSLFKSCQFPGLRKFHTSAIDAQDKSEPKKPGDAPSPPQSSNSFSAQQQYQVDLEDYLDRVSTFQAEMDDYTNWRKNYESAMGKAEGLLGRFENEYGSTFDININRYWLTLGGLNGVMLGIIFAILKFKD